MGEDGRVTDVVDLISDDYVRTILRATRDEARSVDSLSDACDADPSTVYRRVERLEEAGLVESQQQLDPDGHHYSTYRATLDAVHISLDEDGFTVEVEHSESAADKFTRLYEGFK